MDRQAQFNALMFYALDNPPEVLYQYTSMEALLSIVKSERIRATHARYLNDTTELAWMWRAVVRQLKNKLGSGANDEQRQYFTDLIQLAEDRTPPSEFVASFSEQDDDLGQWRAYCPGGIGFSIGFDTSALRTQWVWNPSGGIPLLSEEA